MDRWDGQTYRRVLILLGAPVEVAAIQTGSAEVPELIQLATGVAGGQLDLEGLAVVDDELAVTRLCNCTWKGYPTLLFSHILAWVREGTCASS
jgi:hypothetical protein